MANFSSALEKSSALAYSPRIGDKSMSMIKSIPQELEIPLLGRRPSIEVFAAVGILGTLTVVIGWQQGLISIEKFRSWLGLGPTQEPQKDEEEAETPVHPWALDILEELKPKHDPTIPLFNANLLIWIDLANKLGHDRPQVGDAFANETISEDFSKWCTENEEALKGVTKLDLSKRGLSLLPEGLGQLSEIKELDISDNPIEGFPEVLKQLNLERLTLSHDQYDNWKANTDALKAEGCLEQLLVAVY